MLIPGSKMGEFGGAGHWRPADAGKSSRASSFLSDAGGETNRCGICSTEVVNRGVLDCCSHWFCFACIDDWATVTNLCPLCKARFRFITCLPVSYGDSNDIGAGFAKRVDGSAGDDNNIPFSFPSYFIDEEAVLCLEGNACRVRAGLPCLEAEGTLAADTSVACDLCDCWYHAGCVQFDLQQSSFYCPRCVPSQEKPRNFRQTGGQSGARMSPEARASSLVGLLPPAEKELSYGGGTVFGSASVAIAVAEKGESAVSLSMRRIPLQPSAQQQMPLPPPRPPPPRFPKRREEIKEVMWSPIREPVKAAKTCGPMWSPIREPLNTSQSYELWSPTPGPRDGDSNDEGLWSPTPDSNDEGLWSPTPESERTLASVFKDEPIPAPAVLGTRSPLGRVATMQDKIVPHVSSSHKIVPPVSSSHKIVPPVSTSHKPVPPVSTSHKIVPPVSSSHKIVPPVSASHQIVSPISTSHKIGPQVSGLLGAGPSHLSSRRLAVISGSEVTGVEVGSSVHVAPQAKPFQMPEALPSPVGGTKDEKTLVDGDGLRATNSVEQLPKGKRKPVQEDERRIESKDLPEPPRKVARKSIKKGELPEGRNSGVSKDASSKPTEIVGDKPVDHQSKDHNSTAVVRDTSEEVPPTEIAMEIAMKTAVDPVTDTAMETAMDTATETAMETAMETSMETPMETLMETAMETVMETAVEQIDGNNDRAAKGSGTKGDANSEDEIMELIKDPRNRPVPAAGEASSNQTGVRTRIIMHRETDANGAMGSGIIDRIRQQMKTTEGYAGGEDLNKVGVSDDRFLAAFKAALLSSREKSKEAKPSGSHQGKASWLTKIMDRGKGSRDSLTRKLYAGGTGRWDRDWDIAFWKEKSGHLRKAQKDAEDELLSLGILNGKYGRGDNALPEEEDPIFSRIYVADPSLFPREDDVQLLSAKVKSAAEGGGKAPQQPTLEKGSSLPKSAPDGRGSKVNSVPGNVSLGGKLGSSPKLPAKAGSVQPRVSTPLVTPPPPQPAASGDGKKDKRQWALEVLARKTGASSNGSGSAKAAGSSESGDGQFGLLIQLPTDMRPLVQHNRHSKVPTAVRQVQLNRIVEQELRRAKLPAIANSPECERVVKRAKAREEELFKKSNSRGVYVNLCVRSLAQKDTAGAKPKQPEKETEVDHTYAIQTALMATGLVESPPSSPSHGQHDHTPSELPAASTNRDPIAVPTRDSSDQVKDPSTEKRVDNVLEMGDVDKTHNELESNLGNHTEDPILPESLPSAKPDAPPAVQDSNKMTVVLSTTPTATLGPAKELAMTPSSPPLPTEVTQESALKGDPLPTPSVSLEAGPPVEGSDHLSNGGSERKSKAVGSTDVVSKNQSIDLVSSAPLKEGGHVRGENSDLKRSTSKKREGMAAELQNRSDGDEKGHSPRPPPPAVPNMDDWMNSGKFADLDRRIESIRQSTSPSVDREMDVPWSSTRTNAELASSELLTPQQSVQKQVEIYVNQHLKPLYRSGVINADQFRYAVSKTAAKVMEHHENATSADFLILEGSKVKKLADQYLQNFMKRKVR